MAITYECNMATSETKSDVWDYEGVYESFDGLLFEARYQQETDLFILSRCDQPGDMKTVRGPAFVNAVENDKLTPQ